MHRAGQPPAAKLALASAEPADAPMKPPAMNTVVTRARACGASL